MIVSSILNVFGISDEIVLIFLSDLVFLIGTMLLYKNRIKDGIRDFKKIKLSKKIMFVVKWVTILFLINIIGGILTELAFPNLIEDGNTTSIYSIASVSTIYIVFKTLVFAPIAEELVFKETVRELINNDIVFIITSSLVYAFVNIMYTELTLLTISDMMSYFIFASILSYVQVKNDDNVFMPMLIKFFYNLIPLTILLLGVGA